MTSPTPDPAVPGRLESGTENASTAELLHRASEQISRLVHDEIRLAQAELTRKGRQAGMGAGLLAGAGVLAWYAGAALLLCVGLALALVVPGWLAALVVAVVAGAVAAGLAAAGRRRLAAGVPPVPQEAARSVRADLTEVKERAHR